MKRLRTITLCVAAISGAFSVGAVSAYAAEGMKAQALQTRPSDPRSGPAVQRGTKPLMKPEELALLKEQIRRASVPGSAGLNPERAR